MTIYTSLERHATVYECDGGCGHRVRKPDMNKEFQTNIDILVRRLPEGWRWSPLLGLLCLECQRRAE